MLDAWKQPQAYFRTSDQGQMHPPQPLHCFLEAITGNHKHGG